jgi:hypothetical protein
MSETPDVSEPTTPALHAIRRPSLEALLNLYRKLTGKEPTPEQVAEWSASLLVLSSRRPGWPSPRG